jgi:hypothetical protein
VRPVWRVSSLLGAMLGDGRLRSVLDRLFVAYATAQLQITGCLDAGKFSRMTGIAQRGSAKTQVFGCFFGGRQLAVHFGHFSSPLVRI